MESLKTDRGRALLWPATSRVVGEDNTLNHLLSQLYSEFCEVLLFWKVFIISEMQDLERTNLLKGIISEKKGVCKDLRML